MRAAGRETEAKHLLRRDAFVKGAGHNNISLSVNFIFKATKRIMTVLLEIHITIPQDLTFVGPCIVIYFYSKTNQMHNISNLFYFGTTIYMFRTVFPSIIRNLRLYIQHHTIQVLWLLASKQPQNLYGMMLYV